MNEKHKQDREISVSFTKTNENTLVPTWLIDSKISREHFIRHPISAYKGVWLGLGVIWCLLFFASPEEYRSIGAIVISLMVLVIGILWYLVDFIETYWLEFNRTDGYVYCWKSPKKKQLLRREHIENLLFQAERRFHSSGPKGQTSEYRFYIDLLYRNTTDKKKYFCTVFELFGDGKVLANPDWEDFFISGALAHRINGFIRDFMKGKSLPLSASSMYTFAPGQNDA